MADDQALDGGTGTNPYTAAADDIAGVKYQRVKIRVGVDGNAGLDVSTTDPMPVVQTGVATSANQTSEIAALGAIADAAYVSGSGSIVAVLKGLFGKLPALVSGRVPVDGSGVTQPVSGTVTTTPPSNASTNLAQVAGASTAVGHGTAATALRVELPTDGTGIVGLAAGANAIGKLAANSGVDIGDVDVTSSALPTGAATEATLAAQTKVDNAAFTDGTTPVSPVGYVFDEVAGTALTENDVAAARVDSKRAQVAVLEDATTRGQRLAITAANAAKVDGSAVTQPVSIATNTPIEVRATTGAAPSAFTSTSSAQIFASNAARKLFTVYNNSDKDLYLMMASAAASATSFHVVVKAAGGYFETANYSGEIRGIMAATITTGQVNPGEYT